MRRVRVLVVDDSVVVRRLLSSVLGNAPEIEIAGTAANGRIALAKIPHLAPDLVVLDLEMPVLDGLSTLREIRRLYPGLPVVMFGSLTEDTATTLSALALGPTEFVAKPANVPTLYRGAEEVCDDLLAKIRDLRPRSPRGTPAASVPPVPLPTSPAGVDVVAMGASTGGPEALAFLLPRLPATFPVPIVVVQHMPPMFTARFAERLDATCALTVREARAGDRLLPGTVLLAPGNFHMRLRRDGDNVHVTLDQSTPESFCRPAVDPLLRSVADVYGGRSLALILTGMGQDGLRGCRQLSAVGARIVAQDEQTSVVWGMPGAVAGAGLAHRVLPLAAIAEELSRSVLAGQAGELVPVSAP